MFSSLGANILLKVDLFQLRSTPSSSSIGCGEGLVTSGSGPGLVSVGLSQESSVSEGWSTPDWQVGVPRNSDRQHRRTHSPSDMARSSCQPAGALVAGHPSPALSWADMAHPALEDEPSWLTGSHPGTTPHLLHPHPRRTPGRPARTPPPQATEPEEGEKLMRTAERKTDEKPAIRPARIKIERKRSWEPTQKGRNLT